MQTQTRTHKGKTEPKHVQCLRWGIPCVSHPGVLMMCECFSWLAVGFGIRWCPLLVNQFQKKTGTRVGPCVASIGVEHDVRVSFHRRTCSRSTSAGVAVHQYPRHLNRSTSGNVCATVASCVWQRNASIRLPNLACLHQISELCG